MSFINVEIKAKCQNPGFIREFLKANNADFKGVDHQIDTYYENANGRLKLREGNIEKTLIFYERNDQKGPKTSNVTLAHLQDTAAIKEILGKLFKIKVIVDKRREIYYIGNVKFHIDEVQGLGSFCEIEAKGAPSDKEKLQEQCNKYLNEFKISQGDLVDKSYSDLLK